jgi:hypothetical protein
MESSEVPEQREPWWKGALVWGERALLLTLLVFAAHRFGPQFGALTGVGPTLGRSPDFSFVALDGDTVDSAELLGVVGLATDVGSEQTVRDFLTERGISYSVGRASSVERRAFGGIPGIPTTFIMDREGVIRHRVVGYFAPLAMRAAVSRLLES